MVEQNSEAELFGRVRATLAKTFERRRTSGFPKQYMEELVNEVMEALYPVLFGCCRGLDSSREKAEADRFLCKLVEARTGTDSFFAVGRCLGYRRGPTVTLVTPNREIVNWAAELCRPLAVPDEAADILMPRQSLPFPFSKVPYRTDALPVENTYYRPRWRNSKYLEEQ